MKYKPFSYKDTLYLPWKGYLIFRWGDRFYRFKCDRAVGKRPKYTIKGKDGKDWVRHSVLQVAELIEQQGITKFEYQMVEFKAELLNSVILVSQEFKDDFVALRGKESQEFKLAYRIYPRELARKYPLLMEFEKTRFTTRKSLFRSLQYYLALSLEGGR